MPRGGGEGTRERRRVSAKQRSDKYLLVEKQESKQEQLLMRALGAFRAVRFSGAAAWAGKISCLAAWH